ncbi:MAG: hypothetical protein E7017_03810 [Alphaproteobacteria bacterium]|nr:hypothetical protein [Alphaproteobacteria bacterium]
MVTLMRRVVRINHNKTSVRLSSLEWQAFDRICKIEQVSRTAMLNLLASNLGEYQNLTATIRMFTLSYYFNFAKTTKIDTPAPNLGRVLDLIASVK